MPVSAPAQEPFSRRRGPAGAAGPGRPRGAGYPRPGPARSGAGPDPENATAAGPQGARRRRPAILVGLSYLGAKVWSALASALAATFTVFSVLPRVSCQISTL